MSLTGVTLIAVAFCATAIVLAATVWLWNRGRSLRFLLRPVGVVVTEALLFLSVGLVVNRQETFYPSWTVLFDSGDTKAPAYRTAAGHLDAN
jgi:hypothetical protein